MTIDYVAEITKIQNADHSAADPLYHSIPAPKDLDLAEALLERMKSKATRLRPGKMAVLHSAPNEIIRILLKPYWTFVDPVKYGLGHRRTFLVPPEIEHFWKYYLAKILCTHMTPLRWHLAQGFTVDKHNAKSGIKAERLVVTMCAVGRLFYEICIQHPPPRAPFGRSCHGCRNPEGAQIARSGDA